MTSTMIAPIAAEMIEPMMPPPSDRPIRGKSQPATSAPMMPTTISPTRPKPEPLTI
jgi:hypothetical protein